MTNKNTRRAFLASLMALLLCVSSLLGTTYAWFTDEVTSSNNIIASGNLDVELEYWTGSQWKDVNGASDILTNTLWEPGVTEVAYLRVANAGSLSFKYQLGINIISETAGKNAAGETLTLSDYIMFGVVESVNGETGAYANREAAIAAVTDAQKISAGYAKADSMKSGDELYLALVVYMPTTVDNAANHNGKDIPEINLGINVRASQLTSEKDSFDETYDNAATWVGTIPESLADTTLKIVPGGGSQTGTITINSPEDLVYLNKLSKEWVSLYSNGQGTNVSNYRENVGGQGTDYYYHWAWTVELAVDLDMNNIPMDSVDITYWGNFVGNGHTITNVVLKEGQDGLFNNGAKAVNNLTVKNISVNAPAAETVGAVSGNGSMTNVHVENATVIGGKYVGGICGKGASFVDCSIKNATVIGNNKTVGGLVGYSIGDPDAATVTGNVVENVTVIGAYNVGGLLGQSQNETVEGNTIKNVAVKSTLERPAGASSNEVRTAEVAARSAFDNTTIGANTVENVTLTNVVNVTDTTTLQAAINSGATEIALGAGEFTADLYVVPANRTLTITGQGANTKLNFTNQQVRLELFDSLTITNCTLGRMVNKSWGQLVFGSSTVAGGVYTISNCTFNGVGTQGIYINQTVPATFNIENCTFNGDFGGEGAITIQNNDGVNITVNVTDCEFNNIPSTSHKVYMLYAYNGFTLNAPSDIISWK
ncbi:MAG: SipW-dependent-type signal peptide-containing protein [Clostridia bacterium]|nr:SipW-dependent-type signal peptide-containing protein [Clostridia bacterium]